MPSITKQTVGNNTYLYESHSFRDDEGRPRNRKIKIGKISRETGRAVYTKEYINRMHEAGTPLTIIETEKKDRLDGYMNEVFDGLKSYGLFYFLKRISEKIKLIKILEKSLQKHWEEICMLSFYIIASEKPLMYMEDWLEENASYTVGRMSSQRISDLLGAFGQKERNDFFKAWCEANTSDEYMALDITSISSYSKLIQDCEYGYNRDGEELKQINLCLLFGEETGLPVYQTVYSGSLKDVSTFKATVSEINAVSGGKRLVFVTDKGFYSEKNIKMLVEKYKGSEFLIAVPFVNKWARELVKEERGKIDKVSNIVKTSGVPIRGTNRKITLSDMHLSAYILYNPEREVNSRNNLYAHVAWLKETLENGDQYPDIQEDIDKYLLVKKNNTVEINEKVLDKELETSGWLVMLGNGDLTIQKAHDIYRKKDVVEKAFYKYKNILGFQRLRVHSDRRMKNKLFIGFIAMIIVSYIHKVMKEKGLYKKMTMDKLFITLQKLRKTVIKGYHILSPITKEQREVFSAFSIPIPHVG